ncbi:ATP-NAD kinase-like domain-containing protein [Hygrophoropsis aurantiaca]|uniref:ATP-NAD kinase-like domain-containing protein n=1 Tax=Hygrophoropsis aurantiaca TaxID=72124 RepID=A0ACB8A3U6_9AGAM|nr:ATP-NAD kinase-like domain-containing protein [Hygrophoropsis aurantiaca]
MPVLVIYNPVCGDSNAGTFFKDHVFPLLHKFSITIDKTVCTESAGHAGNTVVEFLQTHEEDTSIILGSGDGTLHEIINAISSITFKKTGERVPTSAIRFVLVPCGTANALYSSLFPPDDDESPSYRLKSLDAYLVGSSATPLTLAFTTLSPSSTFSPPLTTISAVVTSTALHASILHDSESLRKEIPGIDRFKSAARKNITRWYHSSVRLLPTSIGRVEIYDPNTKSFIPHMDSCEGDPNVEMQGPFVYFLSTVNVDRLETNFAISPLTRSIPPKHTSLDLVIIRPNRDPVYNTQTDIQQRRVLFANKTAQVLSAAYQAGNHVNLRYGEDGEVITGGNGLTVVEYIRCGGWEWIPEDIDEKAHLLCSDGTIFNINKGEKAVCVASRPKENAGFSVYVPKEVLIQ